MKKYLSFLLAAALLLTLFAGCAGQSNTEAPAQNHAADDAPADNTQAEAPQETPAAPSEGPALQEVSPLTESSAIPEDVIFDGEAEVYFLVPALTNPRWREFDLPLVQKYLKDYAPNIHLHISDGESDPQKQLQQVEAAIAAGCDFMIFCAAIEDSCASALALLNDEGIPFCSLVHTPFNGDCPMFVNMPFDTIAHMYCDYLEENILSEDIGRPYKIALEWLCPGSNFYNTLKATYHERLDPLVAEGKIEIVFEGDNASYLDVDCKTMTEQMLAQTQNDVDVIITMCDDILNGIAAALEEQGLAGQIKVLGGCDSTISGLARTLAGWQEADVLPDYERMDSAAATICAYYLEHGEYPLDMVNGTTDNLYMAGGVPTVYIDALLITKENMQELVFDKNIADKSAVDEYLATLQ